MADADSTVCNTVQVVYALPDTQYLVAVDLKSGMTAADAVAGSGLTERFPEITAAPLVLGLFGRRIDAHYCVRPGDRIEICRPLRSDPREMRRFMTSQGRVIGQRDAKGGDG